MKEKILERIQILQKEIREHSQQQKVLSQLIVSKKGGVVELQQMLNKLEEENGNDKNTVE